MNLIEAFNTEKRYLTLEGFYPIKNPNFMYNFSAIFNTVISLTQWILMVLFLAHQNGDLIKISEVLLFCMTQSAFISKLLNFIVQKNKMLILEGHLKKSTFCNVDSEESKLLGTYISDVKLLAKMFRVLCVFVAIFYGLFPILDKNPEELKKLPLPLWFPFEIEKSYYFIWFMTVLSICIGAWTNSNIDILTIMLITLATAQFEILKKRLRTIVPINDEHVDERLLMRKLKECIIHFNDINSFVADVEETFSYGIVVQFFCSVIVICLTGFQILVISVTSIQFILLIVYFMCMMCQLVMYCWYGHILMDSSDKISEAVYSTEWFKCNAKIKKSFIIIMERSKVPVKLRAANYFALNLATLMSILKSSYSFFAVLRHIYINKTPNYNVNGL